MGKRNRDETKLLSLLVFDSWEFTFLFGFFVWVFHIVSKPLWLTSMTSSPSMASSPSSEISQNCGFSLPVTGSININLSVKLDSNNYLIWQSLVEPTITAYGKEEFLSGFKKCPALKNDGSNDDSTIKEFLNWKKLDSSIVFLLPWPKIWLENWLASKPLMVFG